MKAVHFADIGIMPMTAMQYAQHVGINVRNMNSQNPVNAWNANVPHGGKNERDDMKHRIRRLIWTAKTLEDIDMTLEEIQKRIDAIDAIADDDESAHSLEDQLYTDFINYVASINNESLAAKAKLVLSTQNIEFSRWCA
jgi:hypothetical protein